MIRPRRPSCGRSSWRRIGSGSRASGGALGNVDEVIRPEDTRPRVIRALEMLRTKRQENPPKKHGNIPL